MVNGCSGPAWLILRRSGERFVGADSAALARGTARRQVVAYMSAAKQIWRIDAKS